MRESIICFYEREALQKIREWLVASQSSLKFEENHS
jgi:hypothetical protein